MSGAIEIDRGVTGGFVDDEELLEELLGVALELNEDMWGHTNLRDELSNPTTCFLSVVKSDLVRVWVDTDGPPSEGWAWFDVDDKLSIVDMACNYEDNIDLTVVWEILQENEYVYEGVCDFVESGPYIDQPYSCEPRGEISGVLETEEVVGWMASDVLCNLT